jgi:TonB-dependent siderophore receptor
MSGIVLADCRGACRGVWIAALLSTTAMAASFPAHAQTVDAGTSEADRRTFDIPAQPLTEALIQLGRQAGLQTTVDARVAQDLRSSPVRGVMTWRQAIATLLSGTGLGYRLNGTMVTVEAPDAAQGDVLVLDTIMVEGTSQGGGFGDAPPEPGGFKAEFQNSATKSTQSIRDTPQSIGVVTRESLDARQVQDLGQALETVAGVNQFSGTGPFAGVSPWGFDETQIRGMALDGFYDFREDGFINPTVWSSPDLAMYERVEAVKGPSSVLYGRGSAGGFINRVRKLPLAEAQTEVGLSAGSFDHYRGEIDTTGPLYQSDDAFGRLVAVYQNSGSFVDGVESERFVVAPSLEAFVTDSTRLLLLGSYQQDNFIPNPGFPLVLDGDIYRAPNLPRSTFFGRPNVDENEWTNWTGTVQIDQELDDDWLASLRLNGTRQSSPIRLDSYAYNYAGVMPGGNVYMYSSAFDLDTNVWTGEVRVQGAFDVFNRPTTLVTGVDHFDGVTTRDSSYAYLGSISIYGDLAGVAPIEPGPTTPATKSASQQTGIFAQAQFEATDRLQILLGGRYDLADSRFQQYDLATTSDQTDKAFTGRVGATYELTQEISVYGLYAQSFVPNSQFVDSSGQLLDPETGDIYEAGLKTEWLDGRLGINAAVFRLERDNVAIPDPDNTPGNDFYVASGTQRSDGIELEINGEPLPGWQLSLAGVLLDSEFLDPDDPFYGSKPAGTADWQVGAFTSYELQTTSLQGLGFGAGLFAIADRGVSTFVPGAELAGYERVDLYAFYNGFEGVELSLQLRNLFNETYVEGADRIGAYAQFGSPRAWLLSARMTF